MLYTRREGRVEKKAPKKNYPPELQSSPKKGLCVPWFFLPLSSSTRASRYCCHPHHTRACSPSLSISPFLSMCAFPPPSLFCFRHLIFFTYSLIYKILIIALFAFSLTPFSLSLSFFSSFQLRACLPLDTLRCSHHHIYTHTDRHTRMDK